MLLKRSGLAVFDNKDVRTSKKRSIATYNMNGLFLLTFYVLKNPRYFRQQRKYEFLCCNYIAIFVIIAVVA